MEPTRDRPGTGRNRCRAIPRDGNMARWSCRESGMGPAVPAWHPYRISHLSPSVNMRNARFVAHTVERRPRRAGFYTH